MYRMYGSRTMQDAIVEGKSFWVRYFYRLRRSACPATRFLWRALGIVIHIYWFLLLHCSTSNIRVVVRKSHFGQIFLSISLNMNDYYSGHPALHPSGQLKLLKIDPVNFFTLIDRKIWLKMAFPRQLRPASPKSAYCWCSTTVHPVHIATIT